MVILTGLTKYLFTRDCLLFTCLPEQFYPWGLNTGDAVAHHHIGGLSPSQAKAHRLTLGGGHAAVLALRSGNKDCDYIGQNKSRRYGNLIPILRSAVLPATPPMPWSLPAWWWRW
jgi:hypothetical protein